MKARITAEGRLIVEAEDSTEAFALRGWIPSTMKQVQDYTPSVPRPDDAKTPAPPPGRVFPAFPAEAVIFVLDRAN